MARIVFMGSPEFAVPTLRALVAGHQVSGVITQPDRPAGRGRVTHSPAVKTAAAQLGLEVMQPATLRSKGVVERLLDWAPSLIVVAAYGRILGPEILELPPHGCLNVHASLLPRWRGAAPTQAAILAGDSETGVTIMKMDRGLDTGGILAQRGLSIARNDTAGTLTEKLAQLGADLLLETVPRYLSGELQPRPQDESLATKAPLLKKEDGLLDLGQAADQLERKVRALNPWPGAYLAWDRQSLKVHRAHTASLSEAVGRRLMHEGEAAVGTGNGVLVLDEVQPPGKKPMSGSAFLAGARRWLA